MKLFYRKYGQGPPLFILHGLYGSSDNWVTIAKKISKSYTVYLPDQRNHGQSPHSEVHDYDSMSSDLLELASELNLTRFFLAGHSMGGKSAISFAMKWPEMIEGLLIADISPFTDENKKTIAYNQHLTILNTILNTSVSDAASRKDVEMLIADSIPSEKVRGLILKNLQRTVLNKFVWKINASSLLDNLEKILEGLPRPEGISRQITGFPVIFLKGENSDYLSSAELKDILKLFPSAELRVIENAGHWLQSDNPEAVAEALLDFLKQ